MQRSIGKFISFFSAFLLIVTSFLMLPTLVKPSNYQALAAERFFSEQGDVTSPPTTPGRRRRSANASFTWPDTEEETPEDDYSIIKDSIKVEELDRRGDGGHCVLSLGEESFDTGIPGVGRVSLVKSVTINMNARGNNNPGTRGRLACKVSGKYESE
ncbi:hypothetical protein KR51_00003770 [Rubidibacter lacunae KORDI 51-2]|uniref:Uncharacterized protein n=1 Tax=Rubidibacter lacunae KORDI 51-2 TaxID=582515 RepID=U5DN18_9CHRO|nr:hypothetical protein [Rubidibacter lacunae]ERN43061.1 hypothetical protein KR51_00003770 [Rubidibacter lacunae KORDI 51-2]